MIVVVYMFFVFLKIYLLHPEWNELFFAICSLVMNYYYTVFPMNFLFTSVLFACVSMGGIILFSKTKKAKIGIWVIIVILFLPCTFWCTQRVFGSNYRSDIYMEMSAFVRNSKDPVFFINDHGQDLWYVAEIQVMCPNIEIHDIKPENLDSVSGLY